MARGCLSLLVFAFLCRFPYLCVGRASVDYTPLEGDAIFEFSWAGTSSEQSAEELALRRTDESEILLSNELLASGFTDEVVEMATAQQEKYTCVLPKAPTAGELQEEEELESKYLTPEYLLQPLQFQCLQLSQGYWSYELCHGQVLRQYHEENTGKEVKLDEYILGRAKKSKVGDTAEEEEEREREGEDKSQKIATWHFNGFDYPYHKVEMMGGSPCDLRGNKPRSVSILYICQTAAPTYGALLFVEESTACHYVAIVGSKQLCQNKDYRLKEQPVYTISCYSKGSSPKKPGLLREQEFEILNAAPKQHSHSDTSKVGSQGSKVSSPPAPGPSLDESIILTFLTGEMCLRGGSGWWIHELCLMKQVKQIHQESDNSEIEVLLGVWDSEVHGEWYEKEGHKKHTTSSVTHLYKGGDICDITGKPRICYVRFKCSRKSKSPSQISLYLTEQTVCVYTLTVEGQFICPLMEELDDHGLFTIHDSSSSRLFNEGSPPADSHSDEAKSESSTESGESQGEGVAVSGEEIPDQVERESDQVEQNVDKTEQESDQMEWNPDKAEQESDQAEQESNSRTRQRTVS